METNKINEIVDLLIKNRNKSITQALHGVMSKSNYYRFVNGEIDISLSKFLKLIKYNDIVLKEISFIADDYTDDKLITQLHTIINSYRSKNLDYLENFIENNSKLEVTSYKQKHILYLSEIYLELLNQSIPNRNKLTYLTSFFYELEELAYFDIVFLANTMNIYTSEFNQYMFKKLIERSNSYFNYEKNENIFIHIVIARIAYLFEIGETDNIEKWVKILNQIKISNNQIYEKLCVKFFNEVNELSRGSVEKTIKAEYYISILEDLEDQRYLLLQEILDNLVESRGILIEKV
ncbi:transcriptional activator, Rgg/GadR/MutR family, C-terminal domain [Enterococcus durans]|uniref:Transcriptional activator, Rgg/GadR/MutR family, C-terminal domain n=1 Tax=Enterococcus durans TaxID=53345 RepID=A0A377KI29_9ENTE|nr:hypothetical protein [Enterococcus durans]STP28857.1 transcriptional activator, Rgg/GadR/MutR family, C-terminal domain [Enterococcus durans]